MPEINSSDVVDQCFIKSKNFLFSSFVIMKYLTLQNQKGLAGECTKKCW